MKGNKSGVSIIPLAVELIGVYLFVDLAGVRWIKKVDEESTLSVGVRYQEGALGPDPAVWLVDANCLSLGRFLFTSERNCMFLVLPIFESAEWR